MHFSMLFWIKKAVYSLFLSIFLRQGITPLRERITQKMRIIETLVARYLHTDEVGFLIGFTLALQFHLSHYQPLIVTIKLIHLEGMITTFHQIAALIDNATLAKLQQMVRLVHRNLLLKLIAGHSAIHRLALNGKVSLLVSCANAHRSPLGRNIALLDMARRKGGALVSVALLDEEFSFYF